jgi:membrane associated rhomboid family serine protease
VSDPLPSLAFARGTLPSTRAERAGWTLKMYALSAPGTIAYLFTLLVTTVVLRISSPGVAHRLLIEQSTNLHNLRVYPVQVLFTSAFWLDSGQLWPALLPLVVFLAPLERWLGTARWAGVFALGHVGATLITAVMLWFDTDYGRSNPDLLRAVDVGISYGCYAVAGALTFRLPRRWRLWYASALTAFFGARLLLSQTFTDVGHVNALLIGFGCYLLVRRRMPAPGTAGTREDLRLLLVGSDADGRSTLDWSLPRYPASDA